MSTPTLAPNSPELVIRQLDPTTIIFSCPFLRFNRVPFGGRSTAIKLKDGIVWTIPSTKLDQQTFDAIKDLGEVKFLVSPDREHHLYLKEWAEAYPSAKLYVPLSIAEKWEKEKSSLVSRISWVFGRNEGDPFPEVTGGEITSRDFGRAHSNEDVAFLHTPTRTLIEADLLFNLPPTEQNSKSNQKTHIAIATKALQPGAIGHKRFSWYAAAKDKKSMSESAKIVNGWDFDRIIPCHGDVIDYGKGKQAWSSTFEWFIDGKK